MHGRQREQRMLDAVVGENDQRAFDAQTLRQDPGGNRAHLPQRIAVGDGRPRRANIGTLAEKNPLRGLLRPLLQPVADAACVLPQRRGRLQPDGAVGAAIGHDLRRGKQRFGIIAAAGGSGHRFPLMPSLAWGWRLLYARTARPGNASSRTGARQRRSAGARGLQGITLPIKWANSIRVSRPA
jgi:hypothetical protein